MVLNFHGVACVPGGGRNAANLAVPLADRLGMVTYAPDYRMPPYHPIPAALSDSVEAAILCWRMVVTGRRVSTPDLDALTAFIVAGLNASQTIREDA